MANSANQKLKLLYVMEMLQQHSDEEHPLTAAAIIQRLEEEGIVAERKSIYRDIQTLQEFGIDIEKSEEQAGFYLASGNFELPELKLLVDAVSASKFITEKKSRELVSKIENLGNAYQKKHLHRQVVVSDRAKTVNERIYYAIDEIYKCIDNNHMMSFQYAEWNEKKEQELRRDGKVYQVSPAFLLWDNEFYYLVAYDDEVGEIRHYRVDKIRSATELSENRNPEATKIKKADYAGKRFSMFAGEPRTISIRAPKTMVGVMIDRFGQDVTMRVDGDDIIVRVDVEVSPQFFGWITGLGEEVVVEGPGEVRTQYKEYLKKAIGKYEI